jgi:hypothetical protein
MEIGMDVELNYLKDDALAVARATLLVIIITMVTRLTNIQAMLR